MKPVRVLQANLNVNYVGHYETGLKVRDDSLTGERQLEAIQELDPDVLLLQEHTSKWIDRYCFGGWPHFAEKTMRVLGHDDFRCRQLVAVHGGNDYPINSVYAYDFGYLQAGGHEHVENLTSVGRQARVCMLAALVELPNGHDFWAITTHGPWVARADLGVIEPHQATYFEGLSRVLGTLKAQGRPIVLGGDFNARMREVRTLLPDWLELITPMTGCSLDIPPAKAEVAERLKASDTYVDGIFVHQARCTNLEVVAGHSDHIWHLVDLEFD